MVLLSVQRFCLLEPGTDSKTVDQSLGSRVVASRFLNKLLLLTTLPVLTISSVIGFPVAIAHAQEATETAAPSPAELCEKPALERMTTHRIARGETLESIANQYGLIPVTLLGFNPSLRSGSLPVGASITIPPYNGIRVSVPAGQTWQDVSSAYNVRADILFEINGCQAPGRTAFIPGVNWSPNEPNPGQQSSTARHPLTGYPLPSEAPIIVSYGWQSHPTEERAVFSNGVGLAATAGTSVQAVGDGIVAFVGNQENFGQVVVINHAQGLQTRYAQLRNVTVQVGQSISKGSPIGQVRSLDQGSAYLYFEIRSNSALGWVAEDPQRYIASLGVQ